MGLVYEARHLGIDKRVAVKVLAQELCTQQVQVERFVREAQTVSRIDHENVVEISDFGIAPNGSVYFVMEYLHGEDLGSLISREGAQPWDRVCRIMLQLCAALSAAHAQGVVHRDIKPQNCFLTVRRGQSDFVKVLDFGIAKLLGDEHRTGRKLTRSGQIFGTPEYMSPEQVRGLPADPRMDVYAAGVILFELLTGRTPYEGDAPLEVLAKHLRDPVPAVGSLRIGLSTPRGVDDVVRKALAKDVSLRYSSAAALAEAILACGGNTRPVVSGPARIPARLEAGVRSPVLLPLKFLVVGGIFLAVAITLFFAFRRESGGPSGETSSMSADQESHVANSARGAPELAQGTTASRSSRPEAPPVTSLAVPSPGRDAEVASARHAGSITQEGAAHRDSHSLDVHAGPVSPEKTEAGQRRVRTELKPLSGAEKQAALRPIDLRPCKLLENGDWPRGHVVVVRFSVSAAGVLSVRARSEGHDAVEQCVAAAARRATFPSQRKVNFEHRFERP